MLTNPYADVSLTTAKYTKLFKDTISGGYPYWTMFRSKVRSVFGDEKLCDMILNMYRYYEIVDENLQVMNDLFSDIFDEYKDYYKELIDNYTKEYDYATGNKKITSRADTGSSSRTGTVGIMTTSVNREYDLPNKVVQPDTEDGYLTGKDTNDGTSNSTTSDTSSNNYGSIVTTEYKDEFLTLKRQYLNQIRNVYHEFAEKFSDCFLHIY